MPCIEGNYAIVIRIVLTVDVLTYILYAFQHQKEFVTKFTSFVLNGNLLILFYLSFMTLTGIEISKSMESFGMGIAALFSFLQLFAITETIIKIVVFTLLNVVAQLTHNYLPRLLNEKLGIDIVLATTVTLLIPVILMVVIQFAVISTVFTTTLTAITLSWLVVQAVAVFSHDPNFHSNVCCDITGYCSIWSTIYELILLAGLIITILLIVFRDWVIRKCKSCNEKHTEPDNAVEEDLPIDLKKGTVINKEVYRSIRQTRV